MATKTETKADEIELGAYPTEAPAPGPSVPATPGSTSTASLDTATATGREVPSLPPVDGGRAAWSFLIAATVIETVVFGIPFSIGVLHNYWATHMFPGHEGTLTLAATLQTGLIYMSIAVLGPVLTAFPHLGRPSQIVGLIVSTAAFISSAFVTSAPQLIGTMGVLFPFASALYLPCATLLFEWFQKRRGMAGGILYSGTGVGGTVMPFIMDALLTRLGYKATMIAVGVAYGAINAAALVFIRRRIPLPSRAEAVGPARRRIDWAVARTWAFWSGVLVLFLSSLGNFNPTLWMPTFADTVGAKKPGGVALVSIMNAASVPGLLMTGWLSDRLPTKLIVFLNCLVGALAAALPWGMGTSTAPLIVFSVVWGLTALSFSSLWTPIITRICQDDPALPTLVFGTFCFLRGIGNFTSGPISTQLLKSSSFKGAVGAYGSTNFGPVLVYTAATVFAAAVAGAFFPA
ncbi:hypothetical protein VHUM_04253 [Vanrija humicola]|uniref:Major facilitator superfamily (MFS) profile domain-containing protein n=1 Tax=Vanrija humicola TaxID=5417 RepID=A0A7D8UW19_VANHU|nr:hypothetical protein VHUM_04253 [Vanrija humicola]